MGVGPNGQRSSLARCTIVNYHGEVVYDKYVAQTEKVVDWRTHVSGIEEHHVARGEEFSKVCLCFIKILICCCVAVVIAAVTVVVVVVIGGDDPSLMVWCVGSGRSGPVD